MLSRIKKWPIGNNRSGRLCRFSVLLALLLGVNVVHAQSNELTFDAALQLALQHSSLTQAAEASVQASREVAVKADQLPDPMLKLGIDNVPVSGPDRFSTTRDFMTMRRVGIEQQWVSAEKRAARSQRAQRAVEMERGNALSTLAQVREETAQAWIRVFYKQRALALYRAIEHETVADLKAIQAAHRGAKGNAADVIQVQLALSQAQDATRKNEQELNNARLGLSRWTMRARTYYLTWHFS